MHLLTGAYASSRLCAATRLLDTESLVESLVESCSVAQLTLDALQVGCQAGMLLESHKPELCSSLIQACLLACVGDSVHCSSLLCHPVVIDARWTQQSTPAHSWV